MGYKGRLYKFKENNENNLNAILNNQLWISNLYEMNDPMDLGFYIDNEKVNLDYTDDDVIAFQESITKSIFCASFTTYYRNKQLWNYYSGGFSGYVIGYKRSDLKKAMSDVNLYGNDQLIEYKNTRDFDYTDFFKKFMLHEKWDEPIAYKSLFTKDRSWEKEKEYRYSLNTPPDIKPNQKGFLLNNIKPSIIIVGYKLERETFEKLKEYCKKNRITLKIYLPNFNSKEIDFKGKDVFDFDNVE